LTKRNELQVCSALILLNAVTIMSAASLNFQAPHSITVGLPTALLAGDFNGDGKTDLFVQGWVAPVEVLLANGNGTFRVVTGTNPGIAATSVVVADFNGDGKLDVAIANENAPETITVFFGQGNGKFYPTTAVTAVGAAAMAAGDVNGDGIMDLVIVPFPSEGFNLQVQVLLGKGNGEFQAPKTIASSFEGVFAPTLIDVNNDGILDLVYGYTNETVTQLGNGDGTFGGPLTFPVPYGPQSLAVADVNGDGKPDILAGCTVNLQPSLCVGLGNGDGTFTSAGSAAVPNVPGFLAVGDFNEDGHPDVVAIGSPGDGAASSMTVLLGKGDGSFPTQTNFAWDGAGPIAVGDWNGDGHADLAVANGVGGTVEITLGDGHGNFEAVTSPSAGLYPDVGIAAADINGHGHTDLAVVNAGLIANDTWAHEVAILGGNGDGTFQPPVAVQVGVVPQHITIADVNGDGIPDMIVTDNGPPAGLWVLLGQGGGTFKPPVYYAAPWLAAIVVKDVNGDGVPDLIGLSTAAAKVVVWLGNGDGTFQAAHGYAAGVSPAYLATGDFNGHGKVDIAVSDRGGNAVLLLLNNGNGTFGPPATVASGIGPGGIVARDFNGDGMTDIAVAALDSGAVLLFPGNGNGTFQLPASFAVPGSAKDLVAADLNGDGNLDLAVTAHYTYQIAMLLGNGAGQFQLGGIFDPGGLPSAFIVTDFNGDGKPDFAILDQVDGEAGFVSIMLNTSN
jgi:hypothetical protein